MKPSLVFLQLVTSGLTADKYEGDCLLEVAAMAYSRGKPELQSQFHALVDTDLDRATACDEKLFELHDANGLWAELMAETHTLPVETVDNRLALWIDSVAGGERSPLICFGTSWVEPWLRLYLPKSLARLSKDRIDLGAMARALGYARPTGRGRALEGAAIAAGLFYEMVKGIK